LSVFTKMIDSEKLETAHIDDKDLANLDSQIQEYEDAAPKPSFFQYQFPSPKIATWFLASFASFGGLLSGVDQSVISGANLFMPDDLGLDAQQSSLTSSAVPLGAVFGSLLITPANEWFGRRNAILISLLLYTVGGALEAAAMNYAMILSSRLILGAGLGLEGGTVPMYVAEGAQSSVRGRLVSLYQLCIALGEVLGYAIAAMFVNVKGEWRYMLGSSLVFSTIMFVGVLFLPESPRWLMHKKREMDAYMSWRNLRGFGTDQDKMEFFEMKHTAYYELENANQDEKKHKWMDFFTNGRARRGLIYANIMVALGQLTGINGIMYYMSTMMKMVGFNDQDAVFMSLVGGGALLIGTIPAIIWMDRVGRRKWAISILPCCFVGLLLVGLAFLPGNSLVQTEGLYLTGILIYTLCFGPYACLTWVLPSESYPTYLRSYGMTISSCLIFLFSFVITYNFTQMVESMTQIGTFLGFYGGIAAVGWVYQIFLMPETKDKTLEELDLVFDMSTKDLMNQNIRECKQFIARFCGSRK
jgi:sugar porter (SP) family MFS transporter